MANAQSFLRSIAQDPANRSLRLIYADWLEEQGDYIGCELIRLEEEMRGLAPFSDRYWELKPRRASLRDAAPQEQRIPLGYGIECAPLFAFGVPDGCKERWRLIREFVERWWRRPLPDVGGHGTLIAKVEARLKRKLSPSLREWVAFARDVRPRSDDDEPILRDTYQMKEFVGHSAVSLLSQCEGDYLWAIRHEDLDLPDPPVHGFYLDDESEKTFVADETNPLSRSLTEFVLGYSVTYVSAEGGGLGGELRDRDGLIRGLSAASFAHSTFGALELFEAENILVLLSPTGSFSVNFARPTAREAIPDCLRQ